MRILHLSDQGLPDSRVEKSAYSAKKLGYSVYFAGGRCDGYSLGTPFFDGVFELPFTWRANIGDPIHWHRLRKKFEAVRSETRPDIIHANNIICAKLASESRLPYVLDDHELASVSMRMTHRERKYMLLHARIWEKWENDTDAPVITVSEPIALHYRKLGCGAYLVPNMPCKLETDAVMTGQIEGNGGLRSVYVGGDFMHTPFLPHRNMDGFLDLFKQNEIGMLTIIGDDLADPIIRSTGRIPHLEMMRELGRHHIGLIPWHPHAFHAYCNPNKAYEYVNAGLLVLITSDLTPVINTLGRYCVPFDNYQTLVSILSERARGAEELAEGRDETISYARNNFVWEKYEARIFEAYKNA